MRSAELSKPHEQASGRLGQLEPWASRLPGCWDSSLASLSISPHFQRKRGPPSVVRNQPGLATHTLVSYASNKARAPAHWQRLVRALSWETQTIAPSHGLERRAARCTDENISPLYAKGGRHRAALVTDLATEHLHTLQNGLVTHGCKGRCPETEEAWRLRGEVRAATKSTGILSAAH